MSHPIVTEARSWVGTRFAHQGRRKKTATDAGGVDCLGLLIGVAAALNLKDRHGQPLIHSDETDYSKLPNGQRLSDVLSHLLFPIPIHDMQAGDIALFRIDGNPQHLGIISNYLIPPPEGALLHGSILPSRHSPNCKAILRESSESDVCRDIYRGHAALLDSLRISYRNSGNDGGVMSHAATPLQGEEIGIIHAYAPSRKVVEHRLDEEWKKKMVSVFRVP